LTAAKSWIADRLAVIIRREFVQDLHSKYLVHNAFDDILLHDRFVDNPDGRITQDCQDYRDWATMSMSTLIQVTQMPAYVIWYGYHTIAEMGWTATLICLAFGVLSIVACRLLMAPIVRLTYKFEAANASYRLGNVRVKEQSEEIALNHGETHEHSLLERGLAKALGFQLGLANFSIGLNVISNVFNYFDNGLVYVCIDFSESDDLNDYDLSEYVGRV
jgi:ABC-type uncharacterized transport system fused permease/ATPase subunit